MRTRREGDKGEREKERENLCLCLCIYGWLKKVPRKKMDSTSGGQILVKSKPIFKNHISTKKFPTIWDFVRPCSFIRLEVMIFVLFRF